MNKSIDEAYDLFEDMTFNHYQWSIERDTQKKVPRKYNVDALDLIVAKVDALTQKVDKMSKNAVGNIPSNVSCEICCYVAIQQQSANQEILAHRNL